MRVLVTGGAGSFGQAFVRTVLPTAERVVVYSRDEGKHARFAEALHAPPEKIRFFLGDVRDPERLEQAMWKCDVVVHAAALKRIDAVSYDPLETIRTNVLGTVNVCDAAVRAGVGRVIVLSSDKACVTHDTPILMEDGFTLPISAIVRYKLPVRVSSLGPDGVGAKDVTGWFRTRREERQMYRLTYEGAPVRRGKNTGIVLTGDHLVLTTEGWMPTAHVRCGTPLVTAEPSPNARQEALIVGTLLGDSSIPMPRSARPAFRMGHAQDQQEWLEIKVRALDAFGFRRHSQAAVRRPQAFLWACARASRVWQQYRAIFYGNDRRKRAPRVLIGRALAAAPEVLLAAWYLDDGCLVKGGKATYRPSARLATHAFLPEDVEWLVAQLRGIGLNCSAYRWRQGYREIRFGVDGAAEFFRRIAHAVPPSLRFKLPADAEPYSADFWNLGSAEQMIAPAKIAPMQYARQELYCLGVAETENFIAGGLILHNCDPANLYGVTKLAAEFYAVQANAHALPRGTKIACVRYGNVLGSRGSVVHVWRRQAARGEPLTITDPDCTRFWITLPHAVAFVLSSLTVMRGGEVFVPILPSMRLSDLADAVAPDHPVKIIGLRPGGEKRHETIVTAEEMQRTVVIVGERFIIEPTLMRWGRPSWLQEGRAENPEYRAYRSDTNWQWLRFESMRTLLAELPEEAL